MSHPMTSREEHRLGRQRATARDMAVALLVLMIPAALIVWFFTSSPDEPTVPVVDARPVVSAARAQAPFDVPAPAGLPSGWRLTRAQWAEKGDPWLGDQTAPGNQMLLNYLSPDAVNVQLWVSDQDVQALLPRLTRDGGEDGISTVGGTAWLRYLSADGRTRSLVQRRSFSTVVVVGDAAYPVLEDFAGRLATT